MKKNKLAFEYILTRKNVKNINCRIKNDGIVYVSANKNIPLKTIEEFLFEKQDLILDSIKKTAKRKKVEFIDGEKIKILNKVFILKLIETDYQKITIKDNILIMETYDISNLEDKEKLFNKFSLSLIRKIIEPLSISVYNQLIDYNIPFPQIKYKKLKSLWGSCNSTKKIITFNSNLIFTNSDFIYYVVLHEFTHLIHQNHQKEFYNVIEKFMPNYKNIRRNLYE